MCIRPVIADFQSQIKKDIVIWTVISVATATLALCFGALIVAVAIVVANIAFVIFSLKNVHLLNESTREKTSDFKPSFSLPIIESLRMAQLVEINKNSCVRYFKGGGGRTGIELDGGKIREVVDVLRFLSKRYPQIVSLSFADFKIKGDVPLEGIEIFRNLKRLIFKNCPNLTEENVKKLLKAMPFVKRIDLKSCEKISTGFCEELVKEGYFVTFPDGSNNRKALEKAFEADLRGGLLPKGALLNSHFDIDLSKSDLSEEKVSEILEYLQKNNACVVGLNLSNTNIKAAALQKAQGLPISNLVLRDMPNLSDEAVLAISGLPDLEKVDFSNSKVSKTGFLKGVMKAKNLKVVRFDCCENLPDEVFQVCRVLPFLAFLSLENSRGDGIESLMNKAKMDISKPFVVVSTAKTGKRVDIFSFIGLDYLKSIGNIDQLVVADGSKLKPEDFTLLRSLLIKSISFGDATIELQKSKITVGATTKIPEEVWLFLEGLEKLDELSFSECKCLKDKDLERLSAMNVKITTLNLSKTNLRKTDFELPRGEAQKHISYLLSKVQILDLRGNSIEGLFSENEQKKWTSTIIV